MENATPNQYAVGDGITIRHYSDRTAATVIEVRRNGKEIVVQEDTATLDPSFKPNFVPGGFAGHCTNQQDQSYTYERNPEGAKRVFTIRSKTFKAYAGRPAVKRSYWKAKGARVDGRNDISAGRNAFYDYNF